VMVPGSIPGGAVSKKKHHQIEENPITWTA